MAYSAHIDVTEVIKGFLNEQLDQDNADTYDNVVIDYSKVKMTHKAFPRNIERWLTTSQDVAVHTNGGGGETEVYFKAHTDMTQSFKIDSNHAAINVNLEIPAQFRLPMIGSATGSNGGYPKEITIPHIGEGDFEDKSRCPVAGPDGRPLRFKEMTIKGEIVVYTHFDGNVRITKDGHPQELPLEQLLEARDLIEVSENRIKNFVSQGIIKIQIKKQEA